MLWVTFNSASESLGRIFGIEPPVACLFFETKKKEDMISYHKFKEKHEK